MKRKLVYWLLGDRAARLVVATWNWLWGIPVESGGKVAVEVAQESLHSMQQSVVHLTESVAKVVAAHRQAREKYEAKKKELQQAEHQALLAKQVGNQEAARLAMMQAIMIERLLTQLEERVKQAEQIMIVSKEKLERERHKLEAYKAQMQNLKALSEVNEALAVIAKVNTDLNLDSARSHFEAAESAVQHRHLKVNALSELSENPTENLVAELNQLTLDDEITQRLHQLNTKSSHSNN